jgi:DNA-binding CsgD family transcriptional regulator
MRLNTVNVSLFEVPGRRRDTWTLIHVLQPVEGAGLLARLAGRLGGVTDDQHEDAPALTHREREILRCVAAGFQNKEIARELHISHATVRNHIQNLLRKLDVHSKLEAVSLAFRKGWVEGSLPGAEVIPMDRGRGVVRLGVA